jgi:large subunit ribosomal protein L21
MYAIVEAGGGQHRVQEKTTLDLNHMGVEAGDTVVLDRVLMVRDDEEILIGRPTVEGAKVICRVLEQRKGPKVLAFRYKPKKRVRVRRGHRQLLTRLVVERIEVGQEAHSP